MRVLVVSERWWPEGGGAELATYLITRILKRNGFDVTVVHGTLYNAGLDGVKFIYTPLLSVRTKHLLWLNTSLLCTKNWFKYLLKRSEIVYIPRISYPVIKCAKELGKRVIVHLHDYQPVSYNGIVLRGDNYTFKLLEPDLIRVESASSGLLRTVLTGASNPLTLLARIWVSMSDKVLCASSRQAEIVSGAMPEIRYKIGVVYNPLPPDTKSNKMAKALEPMMVYSGGENYIKGFNSLLEALPQILTLNRGLRIALLGKYSKPMELQLLEKTKRVIVRGYVSRNELLKIYARAWAVLVPSLCEEPLPYSVMESMLAGAIPIAANVGGIPEIVMGTPAERYLFEPGDIEEMISKIRDVLSLDRASLEDLGYKLKDAVRIKFSGEKIEKALVRAFAEW